VGAWLLWWAESGGGKKQGETEQEFAAGRPGVSLAEKKRNPQVSKFHLYWED
jgi:hypothetical protein